MGGRRLKLSMNRIDRVDGMWVVLDPVGVEMARTPYREDAVAFIQGEISKIELEERSGLKPAAGWSTFLEGKQERRKK